MPHTHESQFRQWIESLAPPGRGQGTRIAQLTGLTQSYVSRILRGKVKGNPRTETIRDVAAFMGRDYDELLIEIYQEPPATGRLVVPIDERAERELLRVMRDHPGFARATLDRYRRAKSKGLLQVIDEVADLILEKGLRDSYVEIGRALERAEIRKARRQTRPKRRHS
jgi:transcriptional regulator with XRE-family HTH domain